jgi:hypothetical protein
MPDGPEKVAQSSPGHLIFLGDDQEEIMQIIQLPLIQQLSERWIRGAQHHEHDRPLLLWFQSDRELKKRFYQSIASILHHDANYGIVSHRNHV